MLQLGQSVPWPEALMKLTGRKTMTAEPLLEYFRTLYEWLREDNRKHGEYVGWEKGKFQDL